MALEARVTAERSRDFVTVQTLAVVALTTYLIAMEFHVGYMMHFLPMRDAADSDVPQFAYIVALVPALFYVLFLVRYHVLAGEWLVNAVQERWGTDARRRDDLGKVTAALYVTLSAAIAVLLPFAIGGYAAALNHTYEVVDLTTDQVTAIGLHEGIIVAREDHGALVRIMPYDRATNSLYTNVRMFDDLRTWPVEIRTNDLGQHIAPLRLTTAPVTTPEDASPVSTTSSTTPSEATIDCGFTNVLRSCAVTDDEPPFGLEILR
jgi:hypothetical protein